MPKYSYGFASVGLYIWEHDNEEPPSTAHKILHVEGNDFKVAAFVVKALNARYKYEKAFKKEDKQ